MFHVFALRNKVTLALRGGVRLIAWCHSYNDRVQAGARVVRCGFALFAVSIKKYDITDTDMKFADLDFIDVNRINDPYHLICAIASYLLIAYRDFIKKEQQFFIYFLFIKY